MLGRRLTTILPAMTLAEAIDTTHIHCVAGLTGDGTGFVTTRPFRSPHHTMLGCGADQRGAGAQPREVSLALACGKHQMVMVSRLRWDAALYHRPGLQPPVKRGPKPLKGRRERSLQG